MRKINAITQFILDLSYLLDKGVTFPIQEVKRHIENRDVIDWLEKQFPFGDNISLDFSLFKSEHRVYIHNELESVWAVYNGSEKRKWGIENNGLCILLSWSVEILSTLYTNKKSVEDEWI